MEGSIPEWLKSMINAEFNTTQKRTENEKGFFCVDCGGNSITRKEKEEHHNGHTVLQAFNTSRKYGYKDKDVLKLGSNVLDVSGIRPFSINTGHVFFPKSRSQRPSQLKKKGRPGFCFGCGYGLGSAKYSFCSILCKVSYREFDDKLKTMDELSVEQETLSQNLVNKKSIDEGNLVISEKYEVNNNQGFRKRRRKGIPQRAPLY
ncbi:hypothetical protein RND81_11G108000 [Saponaria officinalis]|uniref:Uncharacterized protein n=1 Tax=Saponaria officinalis TaxID=3572 RepID=A0AAW1HM60_SAPOF